MDTTLDTGRLALGERELGGTLVPTVNARDLHAFLEVGKDFSTWIKDRIQQYEFLENQDFVCSPILGSKQGQGGHNRLDYHLALDMAKELAMVERTPQGRAARRYFIECERRLRAVAPVPPRPALPEAFPLDLHCVTLGGREVEAVDGRELHSALGLRRKFTTWMQQRIEACGLRQGEDFEETRQHIRGRRPLLVYRLSLEAAKRVLGKEPLAIAEPVFRMLFGEAPLPSAPPAPAPDAPQQVERAIELLMGTFASSRQLVARSDLRRVRGMAEETRQRAESLIASLSTLVVHLQHFTQSESDSDGLRDSRSHGEFPE